MQPLWTPSLPVAQILLRGVVIYVCVLLFLRLGGKRQIGQMGPGEFVALLLISNAVQNSMNGGDNSIGAGLMLAAIIVGLSWTTSYFSYRFKAFENLVQGRPRLLVYKGEPVAQNLSKEHINPHELKTMLRHLGIHGFDDIHEAVIESDGSLSVVRASELPPRASLPAQP